MVEPWLGPDNSMQKSIEGMTFSVTNITPKAVNIYSGEVLAHAQYCHQDQGFLDINPYDTDYSGIAPMFPIIADLDADTDESDIGEWEVKTFPENKVKFESTDSGLPENLQPLLENGNLDKEQVDTLRRTLIECVNAFVGVNGKLGRTSIVKHTINTNNAAPIRQAHRRLPLAKKDIMQEELDKMSTAGVIVPSNSPWAAPIVLVTKSDGSIRFCVDYRLLNNITRKDAYPLPRIDECFDALSGAVWFCTMDLASGYWQVEMAEDDRAKTAFTTQQGLYEFKVMPFGLCRFSIVIPAVRPPLIVQKLLGHCIVYLDDVIVFGRNFGETIERLQEVLKRLQVANLKLKAKKCYFFQKSVHFLGHIVGEEGVKCDPTKVEKVQHWPEPTNLRELQSFVGFTNYYRRFVPDYSSRIAPLLKLTRKNVTYHWDDRCQQVFQWLKDYFSKAPILAYPQADGGHFILDTDASGEGIGAVLSQLQEGEERVIGYASMILQPTRKRYCTTYLELYAVVCFVKHFRKYLLGRHFLLRTDHASLTWLLRFRDIESGMLARWLSTLAEHRAGTQHGNADGLSRRPETKSCKREDCPICSTSSILTETDEKEREVEIGMLQPMLTDDETADGDHCRDHGPLPHPETSGIGEFSPYDSRSEFMNTTSFIWGKMLDLEAVGATAGQVNGHPHPCAGEEPCPRGMSDRVGLPGSRGDDESCRHRPKLSGAGARVREGHREGLVNGTVDLYNRPHCNASAVTSRKPVLDVGHVTGHEKTIVCRPVRVAQQGRYKGDSSWCMSWSKTMIRSEVQKDTDLSWILLQKQHKKPLWREILNQSAGRKTLWATWDELEIRDELLYKKAKNNRGRMLVLP